MFHLWFIYVLIHQSLRLECSGSRRSCGERTDPTHDRESPRALLSQRPLDLPGLVLISIQILIHNGLFWKGKVSILSIYCTLLSTTIPLPTSLLCQSLLNCLSTLTHLSLNSFANIYIHIIYIHKYILYKFRQSHKIHTQNLNKLSEIVDPSSIIVIRIETHPDKKQNKKQKKCKKICMYVKLFFIYLVPVCASVCI